MGYKNNQIGHLIWCMHKKNNVFSFPCPTLNSQCDYSLSFYLGFYGVMVSTLDFESSDPSSNLGRTWSTLTPWRNGSASDSRSEGCVFESRRGQTVFVRAVAISTEAKTHFASNDDWTHDLWFTRPTLCHWAIEAFMDTSVNLVRTWMQLCCEWFFYLAYMSCMISKCMPPFMSIL